MIKCQIIEAKVIKLFVIGNPEHSVAEWNHVFTKVLIHSLQLSRCHIWKVAWNTYTHLSWSRCHWNRERMISTLGSAAMPASLNPLHHPSSAAEPQTTHCHTLLIHQPLTILFPYLRVHLPTSQEVPQILNLPPSNHTLLLLRPTFLRDSRTMSTRCSEQPYRFSFTTVVRLTKIRAVKAKHSFNIN